MTEANTSYIKRYAREIWDELTDDAVIEVAVNPDECIWIERAGDAHMRKTDKRMDANAIRQLTGQIAGSQGTKSGRDHLITSAMIDVAGQPVRVQCVLPPACQGAGSITIRKFSRITIPASAIGIIEGHADDEDITRAVAEIRNIFEKKGSFEEAAGLIVESRLTVLVSGGTGSGKTTILKALLEKVDANERVISIEDVPELLPDLPNYVGLIADRDSDRRGPKQLLASVLRMRPDRFLVGELRGDEARMFVEAVNTGHAGSFSTMHANSAGKAINRLVLMGLGGAGNISPRTMVSNICDTIDLVLQTGRNGAKRGVTGLYVPAEHVRDLREKF